MTANLRKMISCAALVLLTAATAFSQSYNPSTTGALLTINGTVTDGTHIMNVSLSVSDKDIHSPSAQTVPLGNADNGSNCTAADLVTTDAYVLQAGAPTGCDPGNVFEGALSPGTFSFTSGEGALVSYNLVVTTSYVVLSEGTECNSSETICSNNTSFLTVTNNSGSSSFTGTITLAASSPHCGTNGLVFDSFTGTLPVVDQPVTLALAQDASACGGFTSLSQTHTLERGVQSIYTFFNDQYKITPSPFSNGGESLTITFVPTLYSAFTPPSHFPTEACVPFKDISPTSSTAPLDSDVCGTYQADCSVGGNPNGGDCSTLLYTVVESYDLPPNLPAIGGPDFLVVHGKGCPTSGSDLAQSIFTDYSVTRIDPTTKGGGGGLSCFEVTYTPTAPPITSGTTSSFTGFEFPVSNTRLNPVFIPLPVWLSWDYRDSSGTPVTNLSLCNKTNVSGCTAPWVNLGAIPIACPSGPATGPKVPIPISSLFNAGLLNFGRGEYAFPWNTGKGFKRNTCASIVLKFDSGLVEYPATFQFH